MKSQGVFFTIMCFILFTLAAKAQGQRSKDNPLIVIIEIERIERQPDGSGHIFGRHLFWRNHDTKPIYLPEPTASPGMAEPFPEFELRAAEARYDRMTTLRVSKRFKKLVNRLSTGDFVRVQNPEWHSEAWKYFPFAYTGVVPRRRFTERIAWSHWDISKTSFRKIERPEWWLPPPSNYSPPWLACTAISSAQIDFDLKEVKYIANKQPRYEYVYTVRNNTGKSVDRLTLNYLIFDENANLLAGTSELNKPVFIHNIGTSDDVQLTITLRPNQHERFASIEFCPVSIEYSAK